MLGAQEGAEGRGTFAEQSAPPARSRAQPCAPRTLTWQRQTQCDPSTDFATASATRIPSTPADKMPPA
jgi:hypothetical protein